MVMVEEVNAQAIIVGFAAVGVMKEFILLYISVKIVNV
jgi:hypothetical protein